MSAKLTRNTLDVSRLPALLTTAQYAAIAQCTKATVRRRLRMGELDGCKVGSLWRVRRHEVEKLLGVST